jgi:cell wall-associated NlpC family hydrolase
MIRVRRRGTTRSTPLVVLALFVAALIITPTTAQATSISTTQAQIAALTNRLSRLEKTSEITSNQYDADKVKLATITANIKSLQGKEKGKRSAIKVTAKELVHAVIQAYVLGASDAQIFELFNQNATQQGAATVYQNQVIGNLDQLKHTYMKEKTSLDSTIRQVGTQRADAGKQTYAMSQLLALNIYNTNTTQHTLHTMTVALKGEIIAYEIQQGVIAAENHNLAGEEDAITAASAVGGQNAANQVTEAIQQASQTVTLVEVGSSAQGLAAVAAAKREIGVPYVWGGETPGVGFDCSGLVQWAWAQAGIQIPRTTESQWPDLVHVALNDLQPGDLLFYSNLDGDNAVDHVVMYVGSGPWGSSTVIAAAHTGTNVSLAPVFTNGLIGAARP